VSNSGTITVSGTGAYKEVAGIYVSYMESGGSLTNSGSIIATGGQGAYSLYVDEGNNGVISNSGLLRGDIQLYDTSLESTGTLSIPVGAWGQIDGDYTQMAGGVFEVGVLYNNEGGYGLLNVSGTADLSASGAINVLVSPNDMLADQETIQNILSAGTLITDGLTVTDNSALWSFTAVDDGDGGIDLVTTRGLFIADAVEETGPEWALPAAQRLDIIASRGPGSDMASVLGNINSLSELEQVSGAAAQMVPVLVGQSSQMANLSLNSMSKATLTRLAARNGMSAGDEMMSDRHLWLKPYGSQVSQNQADGIPGYDGDSYGIMLGYDQAMNDAWTLGAAIGYSQTEAEDDSPLLDHQLDVDSLQVAAYAEWEGNDNVFLDLVAVIGNGSSDSERRIQFADINRVAKGSYDSRYSLVNMSVGRNIEYDNLTLAPIFSATYAHIKEDGYTETGAGDINLEVKDSQTESLVLAFGARAAYKLNDQGSLLTGHLGFGFDISSSELYLDSSFVGGAGKFFRTTGPEPDSTILQGGVGLEFHATEQADIYVNYDVENRDNFTNQTLSATLRWSF